MSKHTPGPWFCQERFLTIYNMSGGTSGLTCAIAKVVTEQSGSEAAKTNARLIAAAPDLLDALKEFVLWGECSPDDRMSQPANTLKLARAAIAKATQPETK
jgi:hypothetical protein